MTTAFWDFKALLRAFMSSPIHRFVKTHPVRFVVCNHATGWNLCERCGREHRVWMTMGSTWARTPRKWRSKRICTRCWRGVTK